eukprot:CAMPEP_0198202240 /NCGR_PEP_ID=MMETSP1445-20131203/5358_1 /TAXON_ID=36898 /ORGANISM="Pyramimonas sp., Strain CCMP2087" /LENGTH=226 /DNA_ID=CAMNT_0043873049 /DNA_START=276 /DNA_END=956 /DNA_ORIENTATION=-
MKNPYLRFLVGLSCFFAAASVHDTDPFVGVSLHARSQNGIPLRTENAEGEQVVVIHVPQGAIRIKLLPDLAKSSVEQVLRVARQNACASECKFYRAEPGFLLQGSIRSSVASNTQLGSCPSEFADKGKPRSVPCPAHDPNCGCHGPIMVPRMVGWAGGGPGPDFFIYAGQGPATHWNNDHTVWGEIADDQSMQVVEDVLKLPSQRPGHGMAMLDEPIHFEFKMASV